MSFFANPFKRRRPEEELELDNSSPDGLAPETPPNESAILLGSLSPTTETTDEGPPQDNKPSQIVREKAAYFESIIKERVQRQEGFNLLSRGSSDAGSDCDAADVWRLQTPGSTTAATVEALRLQLERAESERRVAVEALQRKTQEVENLTTVIRELSESRAAALSARASLAERYHDLHREHARVARVADLSRTVSKENLELTRAARSAAALAEREAFESRREAIAAGRAERLAADENARLREQLGLLERLGLEERVESICSREFKSSRVCETY